MASAINCGLIPDSTLFNYGSYDLQYPHRDDYFDEGLFAAAQPTGFMSMPAATAINVTEPF